MLIDWPQHIQLVVNGARTKRIQRYNVMVGKSNLKLSDLAQRSYYRDSDVCISSLNPRANMRGFTVGIPFKNVFQ